MALQSSDKKLDTYFRLMQEALTQLQQLATAIHPLSATEWEAFAALWKPFTAKRKTILTVASEKEKYLYFIAEGVQRMYYFDEQDREATILFTYAPSFGGVLDAGLLQQPSRYFYETLTPSQFLRTSYPELHQAMQHHTGIEILIRQGLTIALSGVLERLVELQCFSSEEKFKTLLRRSPHILGLVPHKYLANYLGINATNFSKLMNSIRI
jgi:CRP-like cAMP-binding protein